MVVPKPQVKLRTVAPPQTEDVPEQPNSFFVCVVKARVARGHLAIG